MQRTKKFMKPLRVLAFLWAALWLSPAASAAELRRFVLKGALATPAQVVQDGALVVEDGRIVCAGDCRPPDGFAVIETSGVILPGLVDPHNHFDWNVHPAASWSPSRVYENRYEWQVEPAYRAFSRAHSALFRDSAGELDGDFLDLMHLRGDVQAILGGVTTIEGGYRGFARGLAHNPEQDDRLGRPACSTVFPLNDLDASRDKPDDPDWRTRQRQYLRDCFFGSPSDSPRLIVHLAEGTDALSASEYRGLAALFPAGIPDDRLTVIHGLALSSSDLADMAQRRAYLVWSPSSNVRLYNRTLSPAGLPADLRVALGADWALTGSKTLLQEIRYAAQLPDGWVPVSTGTTKERELALMATERAAEAAGLDRELGRLARGLRADVLVLRPPPERAALDPYRVLASAGGGEVALVLVDGAALYGDPDLIAAFGLPEQACETIRPCGAQKTLCIKRARADDTARVPYTLREIESTLRAKIPDLPDAWECP